MPYESHPYLQTPETDSQPIWRYVTLPKLVLMLLDGALWFSRVDMLADFFEGSYSAVTRPFAEEVKAKLGETGIKRLETEMRDINRRAPGAVFVSSWSMSAVESALLWRAYAGKAGLAIRSTSGRLKQSFDVSDEKVHIAMMQYVDYKKEWIPKGNILRGPTHKRVFYSAEQELRALVVRPEYLVPQKSEQAPRGINVTVNLGILIEAVVLAPFGPAHTENAVRRLLERLNLHFDVRRSQMEGFPTY